MCVVHGGGPNLVPVKSLNTQTPVLRFQDVVTRHSNHLAFPFQGDDEPLPLLGSRPPLDLPERVIGDTSTSCLRTRFPFKSEVGSNFTGEGRRTGRLEVTRKRPVRLVSGGEDRETKTGDEHWGKDSTPRRTTRYSDTISVPLSSNRPCSFTLLVLGVKE